MRISTAIVGAAAGPRVHEIDARWLMAYAAGLGETGPEYYETAGPGGPLVHPLFPVCYEWPLMLDLRAGTVPEAIALRGVHATHDLRLHRLPRPGDRLRTTAVVAAAEARRSGAHVVVRLETVDADGRPVSTTDYGSVYREVEVEGAPSPVPAPPPGERETHGREGEPPEWSIACPVPPWLAHVYTECARIWNPIHTDRAAARAVGLPDIILHGTATLALAVSQVLRGEPAGARARVRRVRGRFGGMVRLPSVLTVEGWSPARTEEGRAVRFQALTAEGRHAVRDGCVVIADREDP